MMLRAMIIAACAVSVSQQPLAQELVPAFDTVSIKRNQNSTQPMSLGISPDGSLAMINIPPAMLIPWGFGLLMGWQLIDLPAWSRSERYDVIAKGDPAVVRPTEAQREAMVRAVLAERFQMEAHWETRDLSVFNLVPSRKDGRLGKGLMRVPDTLNCEEIRAAEYSARGTGSAAPPTRTGAIPQCFVRTANYRMRGTATIEEIRSVVQGMLQEPVIDKTGLSGYFRVDFSFRFEAGPDIAAGSNAAPSSEASLFTMVEEQLGLKLVRGRAPIEVLVVDRFERPTEN